MASGIRGGTLGANFRSKFLRAFVDFFRARSNWPRMAGNEVVRVIR